MIPVTNLGIKVVEPVFFLFEKIGEFIKEIPHIVSFQDQAHRYIPSLTKGVQTG